MGAADLGDRLARGESVLMPGVWDALSARLAAQATVSVSRVAEGVHQAVLGTMGLPGGDQPASTRGRLVARRTSRR